jgi:hypothetical protein
MKRLIVLAMCLSALVAFVPKKVWAQTYKSRNYNGCIRQFYDPNQYNWLGFENGCAEPLYVVYIAFNPGYGGSAMDPGPGRHESTGWSQREVAAKRGFQLYVCPQGYVPVDANNQYVSRVNTRFRCKG